MTAVQRGADSARNLIFLYDPDREVAALDWGGEVIEITTAGSWTPIQSYDNAIIHETVKVGPHPQTFDFLWQIARERFGRSAGGAPTAFNYPRQQVRRLGESEIYRLKITSDSGETKWLSISRAKLARIAAILEEDEDE